MAVQRATTCIRGAWASSSCPRFALNGTKTMGWSRRLCPTPGSSWTWAMPAAAIWSAGPTPDRSRICGEPMEPLLRTISPRFNDKGFSTGLHLDAGGPLAVEQDAVDVAVGLDGQVQPVPREAEITQGGAQPNAVGIVQWHRPDTGGVGVVEVGHIGHACSPASGVEGGLVGAPVGPG